MTPASIARREGRNLVFSGTVNPGNSGGPLLIGGKVIGIVTDASSLAFAVPAEGIIQYVSGVMPNLVKALSAENVESAPDKLIILVADFRRRDQKNYGVTETIINRLRNETKDYSDVQILSLGEHISIEDGSDVAFAKGKERDASIVMWGWYSTADEEVLISVNFEILNRPDGIDFSRENETLRAPIVEFKNNFNIQTRLSNKMAYLTLFATGLLRLEADDYEGAIQRLSNALRQPDAPERLIDRADVFLYRARAYNLKALLHVNDEKKRSEAYRLAYDDISRYIAIRPEDELGYVIRAANLLLQGKEGDAATDIKSALDRNPKSYRAFLVRALILAQVEDWDGAISNLNLAIQFAGNELDERSMLFLRGMYHVGKENYGAAVNDFTKAITGAPPSPMSAYLFFMRGAVHAGSGNYESALADFNHGIRLQPNNPLFYYALAHTHSDNANEISAVESYTTAISLMVGANNTVIKFGTTSVSLIDIYKDRAESYENMGKYANAITDWQEIKAMTTDSKELIDIELKLKELNRKRAVQLK